MTYTMEEKVSKIIESCLTITSTNPIDIFLEVAKKDFVNMHGPEHHVLDGACILTAYYHATHAYNLKEVLQKMLTEGLKMPGGMCGRWGVCGAVSSIGAALSIIDQTGPLNTDTSWGDHMDFTSKALQTMGKINGPRCCKRDGILSLQFAIQYIKQYKNVDLQSTPYKCTFSNVNAQCIKERCPYYQH